MLVHFHFEGNIQPVDKRADIPVFPFQGEEGGVCGGDLTTGLATGGDGIIKLFLASAPAGSLTVRRKLSTSP